MGIFDFFKKQDKKEIKPYERKDQIVLSVGPKEEPQITAQKKEAIELEEDICISIKNKIISSRKLKSEMTIEHKSMDYTTIVYRHTDIARVKWTEETHYIKLFITGNMKSKYENNPIFEAQNNKNEIMWRINLLGEDDIDKIFPVILEVFDSIDNYETKIDLTDKEKEYLDAGARIIIELTNDNDNIYLRKTTEFITLQYKASGDLIKIKTYKKKPWRYYAGNREVDYDCIKKLKIYTGSKKDYTGYFELSNPDDLLQFKNYIKWLLDEYYKYETIYLSHFEPAYLQKYCIDK